MTYTENILKNIQYFKEKYQFEINQFCSNSISFDIFNPHVLVKYCVEELKLNCNHRNLTLFRDKLGEIGKIDSVFKSLYSFEYLKIMNYLTVDNDYILHIINNLLLKLDDLTYAKSICDKIQNIVLKDADIIESKDELNYYIDSLIIELNLYGYGKKTLSSLIYNLFNNFKEKDKAYISEFPFIRRNASDKEKETIINYKEHERLKLIKNCFSKRKENIYFLTSISGIKVENLHFKVANSDVYIYNYKLYPKVNEEKKLVENVHIFDTLNSNEYHVLVKIKAIDPYYSFEQVNLVLQEAIDTLYALNDTQCKIKVETSAYLIYNKNLNLISENYNQASDDSFWQKLKPLEIEKHEEILYQQYSKIILSKNNAITRKLKNSIRYYRNAKNSNNYEERLLNNWIFIENLFSIDINIPKSMLKYKDDKSKFNYIYSLLPILLIDDELFNYINSTYDYYYYLSLSKKIPQKDSLLLQFSNKLDKINLNVFISNINILNKYFNSFFYKDMISYNSNILNNPSDSSSYISNLIDRNRENLLMIYRLRNMIVHNANYEVSFLEYYDKQSARYADKLLRIILSEYLLKNGNTTINNILLNYYTKNEKILNYININGIRKWLNTL